MRICTFVTMFEVHQGTPWVIEMPTHKCYNIIVWKSKQTNNAWDNFKKLGAMSNFTYGLQFGWGCIDDPIPFFMKARCCSPKELYYNSQKLFLCSNSWCSSSFRSIFPPTFWTRLHAWWPNSQSIFLTSFELLMHQNPISIHQLLD